MIFFNIKGQKIQKEITKYLIKWSKKSRSKFQSKIKFQIRPYWKNHVVYEEFPVAGTKMTLDFVNLTLRVAIEVQGRQHAEYTPFFHGKNRLNFGEQLYRDNQKAEWCNLNKIHLVEIHPNDMPITRNFLEKNKLI